MRFLFRFRDLVAETLTKHREVLQEHGTVWWGWWKRPSEDARASIWNEMRELLAQNANGIEIGLFDSGSGNVFVAKVTEVIPPADATGSEVARVPDAERDRIPGYYRESPFSRAWMRLTSIGEQPIDFFGRFSFREAPPLRHYTPKVLKRFERKVIVEPDELRGMDTTIWAIRQKEDHDFNKPVILSTGGAATAVEKAPIPLQSNTVLHLTDLHFATGDHRAQHVWKLEGEGGGRTLADAVVAAVQQAKLKIGAIVITGDLTFMGAEDEFKCAIASIGKMMGPLNLAAEHIVVVPGNHDIQWSTTKKYDENAVVTNAPEQAKKNYRAFYRNLCHHDANETLSMGRRFVLPSGLTLDVAALNSSSLQTGKDFLAGMGKIEEQALDEIALELDWSEPSLALRLLALHHHVVLTENFEPADGYYRGFGIAVDAPRVQRKAASLGVDLVLHGHKHRAFLWKSGVFNLPEQSETKHWLGDLWVLGGGSAGSTEVDANLNFFNALTFDPKKVSLAIFKSSRAGSFDLIQRWASPLRLADGRIALSDWELEKSR